MARRKGWRAVKSRHAYTVAEAALNQGVTIGTMRRWVASGLECMTDQRPYLIRGMALVDFLRAIDKPRAPMAADELYCFTCKAPRKPAFGEAEFRWTNSKIGQLTARCVECGRGTYKATSKPILAALTAKLRISFPLGHEPINKGTNPISNDDLERKD